MTDLTTPATDTTVPLSRSTARRVQPHRHGALRAASALYLGYLLLPIVLLLIGTFGRTWTNTALPTGFTTRWVSELVGDATTRRAFVVSLTVALSCCAVNTLVTVPLAYSLYHRSLERGGFVTRVLVLIPVAVPALALGFGYVAAFSSDALPWLGTLPLLVAAHVVLTLPYLLQTLLSDLRHLDLARLESCAATLGATPWRQFTTVALPTLRHSLMAGLAMVAALSVGEFQVSNLIAGFRYRNYPIVLLQTFYGASGFACAASVVLVLLALVSTGASILFTPLRQQSS